MLTKLGFLRASMILAPTNILHLRCSQHIENSHNSALDYIRQAFHQKLCCPYYTQRDTFFIRWSTLISTRTGRLLLNTTIFQCPSNNISEPGPTKPRRIKTWAASHLFSSIGLHLAAQNLCHPRWRGVECQDSLSQHRSPIQSCFGRRMAAMASI